MKNQMIGKIARVVDGKLVVVAHVFEKCIMVFEPYRLENERVKAKCPGLLCFLTDG